MLPPSLCRKVERGGPATPSIGRRDGLPAAARLVAVPPRPGEHPDGNGETMRDAMTGRAA